MTLYYDEYQFVEESDAEKSDTYESDAEKSDAGESDAGESDAGESDAEGRDAYESYVHEVPRAKLEDPDEMTFIRPARDMPSNEEMDKSWYDLIRRELVAKTKTQAVLVIGDWWKHVSTRLDYTRARDSERRQSKELVMWHKIRSARQVIFQLAPVSPHDVLLAEMRSSKRLNQLIQDGLTERLRMIDVKKRAVIASAKARIAIRKAGKARQAQRAGMNKNTKWHTDRKKGSLVIAVKQSGACDSFKTRPSSVDSGTGRRSQRMKRRVTDGVTDVVTDSTKSEPYLDITMTDEQPVDDVGELARINRACIAKVEREEEEFKIATQKETDAIQAKKDEDEFVNAMATVTSLNTKSSKTTKKGLTTQKRPTTKKRPTTNTSLDFPIGTGIITQARDRRRETDAEYDKRCGAFGEMANVETMKTVLKFTRLCRSVKSGKPCHHNVCLFAHSIEQLTAKECRFGLTCKFVTQNKTKKGWYENKKIGGRAGKTCDCTHPNEHDRSFCKRMGMKYVPKPTATVEFAPVKIVIDDAVSPDKSATDSNEPSDSTGTNGWADIVVKSLSEDEKRVLYGKGHKMLGHVATEPDVNPPINQRCTRRPGDKRGLGFSKTTKVPVKVTAVGFNWVKGAVLLPPKPERTKKWDVKPAYILAIESINTRIADTDVSRRVKRARAKAVEINNKLGRPVDSWTKVDRRHVKSRKVVKRHSATTVFRVPKAHAEMALISAISSGITDFSIEYL